ncbi:MAG: hypothetical protein LIO71_02500 [Ruminococcus sp.]|nr:hypothetical protein [Ruminococcus sp.]MCD7801195.1 hypothetical protein [Ruminococcus sp.]
MAKECRFCGAEMDDNAIKCPECEKMVANAEIILDKQRQHIKKRNTILLVVLICIIFVVGMVIAYIVSNKDKSGAKSYVDAIDMNIASMIDNNPTNFLKSYPIFMRDFLSETLGLMTNDNFDEYIDSLSDEIVKAYGSDAVASYEIKDKQHLDDETIDEYLTSIFEYISEYSEEYQMEDYPVEDAYQLGLEITFNGSIGTQTMNTTVAVMKFDGSWYIMNIINPINNAVDDLQ